MSTTALGDLAQSYLTRSRNVALKQDIARLTDELATGQSGEVRKLLVGNYSFLSDVERKTDVLEGYKVATSEATQFASAMQLALGQFAEHTQELTTAMAAGGSSPYGTTPQDLVDEASSALTAMFATLNTSSAGRQLFSGNTPDQRPLLDVTTLMTDLTAAVSGATSPADLLAQATAWFDNPAGFEASVYRGSPDPVTSFAVSETESVGLDMRANDPFFVPALRGAAVAALATDPTFGFTVQEQTELFGLTTTELLGGQGSVISAQSRVGFAEARIDRIAARNAAEVTSLTIAKNTLLEVDPFEAATRLEEAQFQLQGLYSVTVRMSQLSLVNFL